MIVIRPGRSGFFLHAAALATAETVNATIRWGRGLTCFSVTPERALRLGLLLTGELRSAGGRTVYLRSVEAANCQGTGISAADRAMTLQAAGDPAAGMTSLKSPGHVFPAMAPSEPDGSVGSTALSLLRELTSFEVPAWTEILDDAGELASSQWCEVLAERLGIAIVALASDPPSPRKAGL